MNDCEAFLLCVHVLLLGFVARVMFDSVLRVLRSFAKYLPLVCVHSVGSCDHSFYMRHYEIDHACRAYE